ncbi:hypothetical protein LSUB1_G006394 [Lachnellula subtilissima]|uniref:Uncharacterized protein n=1 Tax=Lachnellula subtilissima TaxID=602034 RepID=A0A8H8U7B4_9HELO|nr:hypothetical protein LSUB1_G006394 [Lachnellula subtilissima]
MAQGAVAPVTIPNGVVPPLTVEELRDLAEYEKIIQFRDAVLAGTHPRIKIAPHLVGKQATATRNFSSPTTSNPRANNVAQRSTPNSHLEDASFYRSPNNNRPGLAAQISKSGKSEINPILLEKSDDLIKAEMQLQRQRLERNLREQIEKQRIATKAALQTSESLPNFDISEVLSKAQAIVHPSTQAEVQPAMADDTAASDSFDENTFYSSQHDSSAWSNSSQGQKEPIQVHSGGFISAGERPGELISTQSHIENRREVVASASLSTNNQPAAQNQHSQHLTDAADIQGQLSGLGNSVSHAATGVAINRNSTDSPHQRGEPLYKRTTDDLLRQAFEDDRASPLIHTHNLSPFAPQPARVSPLATAREPPVLRENILADEAAPAQVAALRNRPTGISSTDSSPKGVKAAERKKGGNKKKKRKAKSVDTADSPYIKPEPRSPSPFPVAPLPRPQKRQRQSGQYAAELNYDEPRYGVEEVTQARIPEPYAEVRDSRAYQRADEAYEPVFRRPPLPPLRRVEDDSYRRTASDTYTRQPQSPTVYSTPSHVHNEARSVRAASHAIVDRRVEETPYYGQPAVRTAVRPDADRERSRSPILRDRRSPVAMGPPRQAVRIVRDEFGNEYYDPSPVRQSVAPPARYREEVVYERPPVRVVSARPEVYEDDGIIYRRPSPTPTIARRVVTQPEYAMAPPSGYRSYREREYSVRPSGEDYVQRRPVYEEPVREYPPRAQSVRPDAVQYEVRDEAPREYAPMAPAVRDEASQGYARAASIRPDAVRYEEVPRQYAAPRVQTLREEVVRDYAPRPISVRPDQTRYEVREDSEYARAPVVREEPLRDYARVGSVRPDAVRYEVPREYVGRVQSVMPEPPPREYASSVRPEARREMIPQAQREFSVRPVDSLNRREQVPVGKGERYYEEMSGQRPAPIAFIERPRARESSVLVYADDVRREVYR